VGTKGALGCWWFFGARCWVY